MHGFSVSNTEQYVYSNTLLLFNLLKIGIPYETIMSMTELEINRVLAMSFALQQKQAEDLQR